MDEGALKRAGNLSKKQKQSLISLLDEDEELRKSKFSSTFTFKVAKYRWSVIAQKLNSIPGAKKDGPQWKRVWADLKKKTKRKNTELKKYARGTGGGPPPPPNSMLDDDDKAILNILDKTCVEGDVNVLESKCPSSITEEVNEDYIQNKNPLDHLEFLELPADEVPERVSSEPEEQFTRAEEFIARPSTSNSPKTKTVGKLPRRERSTLQQSQRNSEELIKLSHEKLKLKKWYYQQKFHLLKQSNVQNKQISETLNNIKDILLELI